MASSVAEVTMIRKSFLFLRIFFNKPNKMSLLSDLTCASSTITTLYFNSSGSDIVSRSRIPSV